MGGYGVTWGVWGDIGLYRGICGYTGVIWGNMGGYGVTWGVWGDMG